MNKRLSGKDLFIIGVCLLILSGLINHLGNIGSLISMAFSVGGLVCLIAAPFNLRNKNKANTKQPIHEVPTRNWGDLD